MDKHLWISSYGLSFYPNQLFVALTQELGRGGDCEMLGIFFLQET